MEPLKILEGYFNTFIAQENPKQFFIGMADYLNYGDALPEYDWITSQISAMPASLFAKLDTQTKAAFDKVKTTHDEIAAYIAEKQIDIPATQNALQRCQAIFDGHIHSDSPMPYLIHLSLYDIIVVLYPMPEHKEFASKYIVFAGWDKTQPRQYLPTPELDELLETKKIFDEGREDAIWGIQAHLYQLREVINRGREIGKDINERVKKGEPGATNDWLNFGVLMGEWEKVKDGHERDPVFFDTKEVRPQIQRFHMHVLANWPLAHAALSQAVPASAPAKFDIDTSILDVQGKQMLISKTKNSDAHYLLSILFKDPDKTWPFDDIWEDPYFHSRNARYDPKTDWRKIYYAGYSVNEKVQKATTIPDFLDLSKTAMAVQKKYLGK
jgi:hypothetical protein